MQSLELAVVPLDVARRAALRLATRSSWLTRVIARRDSRVALLATVQILLLFAFAIRAPIALFFLGPVLFGVVHLAADIRYLVLRRSPPRALLVTSVVLATALTAVRVGVGMHAIRTAQGERLDVALGMTWIGFALFCALRRRAQKVALTVPLFLGFLGVGTVLFLNARLVGLVLIHLHNVIALLAWLVLFRRRLSWTMMPLALVVVLAAVLLSGSALPWTFEHGGLLAFGFHAERLAAWLAPGVAINLAVALTVCFVFLQGVHYAAWIGWIPQDDLRVEGTPTFRMTVRALIADFGPRALALILVAALAFVGVALWDIRTSVSWYMNIAKSHAWFECAFLAYFVVSGERLRGHA